jgi:hypothetical protein
MYNNIGSNYIDMRLYPEAFDYLKKSLKISLKLLGKQHVDTAAVFYNMG